MPAAQPAVTALQELGLTLTESRIYLSLLVESPMNGNQISRSAGVPSAKVYEGLARLEAQGLVAAVAGGSGYVPLPLEELLEKRAVQLEAAGSLLRESVSQGRQLQADVLWHGSGYDVLMKRATTLIGRARTEVLLSAWPAELERLLASLRGAAEAGAHLSVILFATHDECRRVARRSGVPRSRFHLFPHVLLDSTRQRHANELALVVDASQALQADGSSGEWRGVWTDNQAVTRTVVNYIQHDIYINKLYFDLTPQLLDFYGNDVGGLLAVREGGIDWD